MKCIKCGKEKEANEKGVCYRCLSVSLQDENAKLRKAFNEMYRQLSTVQLKAFKTMTGEEEEPI